MPREQRSAGVILFRVIEPASTVFLLLDYGKYWDYPKGHLEHGEEDITAARRELFEETGISAAAFDGSFRHEIVYFFRSKQGLVRKTVVFFLASTQIIEVELSDEHVGYAWLDAPAALARLGYQTARQALSHAVSHLHADH